MNEAAKKRQEAKDDSQAYLATVDSLEPDIHPIDASAYYASAAISLKRIADSLERIAIMKENPIVLVEKK